MGRKRIIALKLTKAEADDLMNAGRRGEQDLVDGGVTDDEMMETAGRVRTILERLAELKEAAGWYDESNK